MFDFKKFRKDKGWTQEVAGDLVFGMSAKFWRKLEQHDKPEQQLIAYGKACELYDSGLRHKRPTDSNIVFDAIKMFCLDYNTSIYEMAEMTGHGRDIIHSLMIGKAKWSKRWSVLVFAVSEMIRESVKQYEQSQIQIPDEFGLDDFDPRSQHDPFDAVIDLLQELKSKNIQVKQLIEQLNAQDKRIAALENATQKSNDTREHESIASMKSWVHDSAKDIVHEMIMRGSLDSKAKMFNNFWTDHNSYVGVSMFADVKTIDQAERSMKFAENRARVLAVPLKPYQPSINF